MPVEHGVQVGIGARFGNHPFGAGGKSVEGFVDAAVVSWYPPYARDVARIRETLRHEAQTEFDAAMDSFIAADPGIRDAVAPAHWRGSLRVVGFLAAATNIAGFWVALGFGRRNQPAPDASTVAVLVGITSMIALGCLGASLLFPSRMGRPNRLVSIGLWLAAISALGSVGALYLRQDTWDASTPLWWALTLVLGIALLVLASMVAYARRRRPGTAEEPDDDAVSDIRVAALTGALDRAVVAMQFAWEQVDVQTRQALERERDEAITALQVRTKGRIDGGPLRLITPGVMGLPDAADEAHRLMSLGAAQRVDRREPGPHGYFVKRSRRQRSLDRG